MEAAEAAGKYTSGTKLTLSHSVRVQVRVVGAGDVGDVGVVGDVVGRESVMSVLPTLTH